MNIRFLLLILGIAFFPNNTVWSQCSDCCTASSCPQQNSTCAPRKCYTEADKQKVLAECKSKWRKYRFKRGGLLYNYYADALHSKRYRNEFTTDQWKTILLQKRVRIPLTQEDHCALLHFFVGDIN